MQPVINEAKESREHVRPNPYLLSIPDINLCGGLKAINPCSAHVLRVRVVHWMLIKSRTAMKGRPNSKLGAFVASSFQGFKGRFAADQLLPGGGQISHTHTHPRGFDISGVVDAKECRCGASEQNFQAPLTWAEIQNMDHHISSRYGV